MKTKKAILIWSILRYVCIVGGVILYILFDKNDILRLLAVAVILAGILITVAIVCMTDVVYQCPNCNAQLQGNQKELTLSLGRRYCLLLTCPSCKKTSFCRRKQIPKKKGRKKDVSGKNEGGHLQL